MSCGCSLVTGEQQLFLNKNILMNEEKSTKRRTKNEVGTEVFNSEK